MLTQPEVRRYAAESGLRDMMIAEKEVVLTFLLQLLAERGILDRLAFKGGTCLRKMFIGSQGRFSTDLDFTGTEEHDHEDVILAMMEAFEQEFHGIRFSIPNDSYYETVDGMSWGINPAYMHEWNGAGSEIKLQVSRRETPTLALDRRPHCYQSYFKLLPFRPADLACLSLAEIIAEKIRACYQRNKARDMYDVGLYAARPLDRPRVRKLVVLKIWQARDTFDPARLMEKFERGVDFDWNDLRDLVHRDAKIDAERICAACVNGFRFLTALTADEQQLARDGYQREQRLAERLTAEVRQS
jgi:predicted nucleotidyltransferase component of viral defense system